jgi:alpha-tubulin suppressor-like RCC1 family protein
VSGTGVIKTDGSLWVIGGGGGAGNPGQNDRTNRSSPVQVPGNWSTAASQSLNGGFFGIKTNGTMWSWGYNENGGMAQNTSKAAGVHSYSSPTQIGTGTDWSAVEDGYRGGSALKTDGTLWVWGSNYLGALAQNSTSTSAYSSPVQIGGTWSAPIRAGYATRGAWKKPY